MLILAFEADSMQLHRIALLSDIIRLLCNPQALFRNKWFMLDEMTGTKRNASK